MLRSTFLVHWTGKDFDFGKDLTEEVRDRYVERLVSLYTNGLYLSEPKTSDIVRGVGKKDLHLPRLPIVCFTEIQIHRSATFARDYGRLGLGFRRDYLMRQGANPVFYLQSANQGIVNTNVSSIYRIVGNGAKRNSLDVILAYFKPMSKPDEKALEFYEEHEWRIVDARGGIALPREFKDIQVGGKRCRSWGFAPEEVALVVFPDAATRAKAFRNVELSKYFADETPMMVDFDACSEI